MHALNADTALCISLKAEKCIPVGVCLLQKMWIFNFEWEILRDANGNFHIERKKSLNEWNPYMQTREAFLWFLHSSFNRRVTFSWLFFIFFFLYYRRKKHCVLPEQYIGMRINGWCLNVGWMGIEIVWEMHLCNYRLSFHFNYSFARHNNQL